jgi:hypothetical protein
MESAVRDREPIAIARSGAGARLRLAVEGVVCGGRPCHPPLCMAAEPEAGGRCAEGLGRDAIAVTRLETPARPPSKIAGRKW